jgi:hypothetical protein
MRRCRLTFPISIREASRRLDIPVTTAAILVRAWDFPTIPIPWNHTPKGLDEAGFREFAIRSAPFRRNRADFRYRDPDLIIDRDREPAASV